MIKSGESGSGLAKTGAVHAPPNRAFQSECPDGWTPPTPGCACRSGKLAPAGWEYPHRQAAGLLLPTAPLDILTPAMRLRPPLAETSTLFFTGQFVRSRFHGMGQVMAGRQEPRVRFLSGPEIAVPGDTLSDLPEHLFHAERDNRNRWERYTKLRYQGIDEPETIPPPLKIDLIEAIRQDTPALPLPPVEPPNDDILMFIVDDLHRNSPPGQASGDNGKPIPVVVTRVGEGPLQGGAFSTRDTFAASLATEGDDQPGRETGDSTSKVQGRVGRGFRRLATPLRWVCVMTAVGWCLWGVLLVTLSLLAMIRHGLPQ